MPEDRPDPNRLLAALAHKGQSLDLSTIDLVFVAGLHLRAEGSKLAAFAEDQLVEIFEQACSIVEPGAENLRKRATHAIQRLRDQRLLTRVDGAGVLRTGEYALTRLATSIAGFFLEEEALTPESLTLLSRTLLVSLAEILSAARKAATPEAWHESVVLPLRVTITELMTSIERRQRGLDLQQEDFQRKVAELLQADWFGAVDRCQSLLESTSDTLRELNEVLLRETHQLHTLLQDIQELATNAAASDAEHAAERVSEQVDRVAAWGSARQRAWSEYYQYVHRYLRDVVRLDPARALTQRLRDQLSGQSGKAFALTVAQAPAIRLLRDVEPPPEHKPPVKRPREQRERTVNDSETVDPRAALEEQVRAVLLEGAAELSEVTTRVTAELPPEQRFLVAGRVVEIVARLAKPRANFDRPWVKVNDDIVIEEWRMPKAEGES